MGKYLDYNGAKYLWQKIMAKFAAKLHTHSMSDITTGTLSVAQGGTGVNASAVNPRYYFGRHADTTGSPSFGALSASDITAGVVPVAHGGTGETTANAAANAFVNALGTGSSTPADDDYMITQYVNGGTTTTTYHRRKMSVVWEYFKSKIQSVALTLAAKLTMDAKEISLKSSNITSSVEVTNAGTTGDSVLNFAGSDGVFIGRVQPRFFKDSAGGHAMQFYATRDIGDGSLYNYLQLGIKSTGDFTVAIPDDAEAAWRKAITHSATYRKTTATTTPTSTTKAALNSLVSTNTARLSASSNGIKCAKAGYVKVTAGYYVSSIASGTGGAAIMVYQNSTNLGEFVFPYDNTMHMATAIWPERVIQVAENDVIYLYIRTTGAGTIAANRIWLTVEYVG